MEFLIMFYIVFVILCIRQLLKKNKKSQEDAPTKVIPQDSDITTIVQ